MRARRAHRIVAHRLFFEIDAGQRGFTLRKLRRLRGREIRGENHRSVRLVGLDFIKVLIVDAEMMIEAIAQFRSVDVQHACERVQRLIDVLYFGGNERADERWAAAHHHDAVAIDDQAARRRDRNELNLIRARRGCKCFTLHQLHLRQANHDRD